MTPPRPYDKPSRAPTRKAMAATVAAAVGTFLADLATAAWPAFPESGEPAFVALLVFAAAYVIRDAS